MTDWKNGDQNCQPPDFPAYLLTLVTIAEDGQSYAETWRVTPDIAEWAKDRFGEPHLEQLASGDQITALSDSMASTGITTVVNDG